MPNEIIYYDTYAEIILYDKNNNEKARALVSLDKINMVKNYKWCLGGRNEVMSVINNKKVKLHRLIMDAQEGEIIDHINRNKLDNRNENLRKCTIEQNNFNKGIAYSNTSGVTGVDFDKNRNKWRVQIGYNGKNHVLGRFSDFNEAVRVRKEAEQKYFGEFAPQNREVIL